VCQPPAESRSSWPTVHASLISFTFGQNLGQSIFRYGYFVIVNQCFTEFNRTDSFTYIQSLTKCKWSKWSMKCQSRWPTFCQRLTHSSRCMKLPSGITLAHVASHCDQHFILHWFHLHLVQV
jgi:hypothetical protein